MKVAMKFTMKFYDKGGKDGLRATSSKLDLRDSMTYQS